MSQGSTPKKGTQKPDCWKFDIEKVFAIRKSKTNPDEREVLVKFKNLSHRRLAWKPLSRVDGDYCGSYFLKMFQRAKTYNGFICESSVTAADVIRRDWLQVDRVVAVRTDDWDCTDESDVNEILSMDEESEDEVERIKLSRKEVQVQMEEDFLTAMAESDDDKGIPAAVVSKRLSKPQTETTRRVRALYRKFSGGKVTRYLVKWRGCDYSECTWEHEETILNDPNTVSSVHCAVTGAQGVGAHPTDAEAACSSAGCEEVGAAHAVEASMCAEFASGPEILRRFKEMHASIAARLDFRFRGAVITKAPKTPKKQHYLTLKSNPTQTPICSAECYVDSYLRDHMNVAYADTDANANADIDSGSDSDSGSGSDGVPDAEPNRERHHKRRRSGFKEGGVPDPPQRKSMRESVPVERLTSTRLGTVAIECDDSEDAGYESGAGDAKASRLRRRVQTESGSSSDSSGRVVQRRKIAGSKSFVDGRYSSAACVQSSRLLLQKLDTEGVTLRQWGSDAVGEGASIDVPISAVQTEWGSGVKLRGYQIKGIQWLLYQFCSGRGSILGDEMGLGKTLQALAFVETLRHSGCILSVPPVLTEHRSGSKAKAIPCRPEVSAGVANPLAGKGGGMDPVMIVAPLSTLLNWQREINVYTSANAAVYYGSSEGRDCFEEFEFLQVRDWQTNRIVRIPKFHFLLTTYEMVTNNVSFFKKLNYSVIIVDEGHRLKNSSAIARSAILGLECQHRVVMTGTPVQNNITELHSLLHFLDPLYFDDRSGFEEKYNILNASTSNTKLTTKLNSGATDTTVADVGRDPETFQRVLAELQEFLRKYLLRREKSDVELSIPSLLETVVHVELTITQKRYYRALLERNRKFLCRGTNGKPAVGLLRNILMDLRKICNHPFILPGARAAIIEDAEQEKQEKAMAVSSVSTSDPQDTGPVNSGDALVLGNPILFSSGKLVLLHKLIPKLLREKSKCLIFSQFVQTLDIIEEYILCFFGRIYERLDGAIAGVDRQAAINRFNAKKAVDPATNMYTDNSSMIFLLTTRAGGVGINLQAANTVIIFDSDWNPHQDVQAISRAHRLGQTDEVKVYRLLSRNSVESVLFKRAFNKMELAEMLLRGMNNSGGNGKRAPELNSNIAGTILRASAAFLLAEKEADAEAASSSFMGHSIEHILQHSTDGVSYSDAKGGYNAVGESIEGEEAAGGGEQGPKAKSVFANAVFVPGSGTGGDAGGLDVHDSEFWDKALPHISTRIGKLFAYFQNCINSKEGNETFTSRTGNPHVAKLITITTAVFDARQAGHEAPHDMDDVLEVLRLVLGHMEPTAERPNEHPPLKPRLPFPDATLSRLVALYEGIVRPKRRRTEVFLSQPAMKRIARQVDKEHLADTNDLNYDPAEDAVAESSGGDASDSYSDTELKVPKKKNQQEKGARRAPKKPKPVTPVVYVSPAECTLKLFAAFPSDPSMISSRNGRPFRVIPEERLYDFVDNSAAELAKDIQTTTGKMVRMVLLRCVACLFRSCSSVAGSHVRLTENILKSMFLNDVKSLMFHADKSAYEKAVANFVAVNKASELPEPGPHALVCRYAVAVLALAANRSSAARWMLWGGKPDFDIDSSIARHKLHQFRSDPKIGISTQLKLTAYLKQAFMYPQVEDKLFMDWNGIVKLMWGRIDRAEQEVRVVLLLLMLRIFILLRCGYVTLRYCTLL